MLADHRRRYRWEFLRRNPRYRKDYQALADQLGQDPGRFATENQRVWLALYIRNAREVEREFPGVNIKAVKDGFFELGRFKEKWRLACPVSPEQTDAPEFLPGGKPPEVVVEVLEPDAAEGGETLGLKIRLSAPRKMILEQIDRVLETYQKLYAEHRQGDLLEPRWAHYDQCIRAYDRVIAETRDWSDAAALFFPDFTTAEATEKHRMLEQLKALVEEAQDLIESAADSEDDLSD
jgi:hypothetical protein